MLDDEHLEINIKKLLRSLLLSDGNFLSKKIIKINKERFQGARTDGMVIVL